MLKRIVSGLLAATAIAYVVFLFLPWAESGEEGLARDVAGVDMVPGFLSLSGAVALALWELLGVAGVRRTVRADSLVSFMLAASTATIGILGVVHAKWGSSYPFSSDLAYGAFFALALAVLLLGGAIFHLVLHVSEPREP